MTQEEKAKRYDEALEELRGLLECVREEKCKILEEDITSIFPELKESDDERIKKCITLLINGLTHEHFVRCGASVDEIKAWLEKQGEQKPQGKTALEAINEEKVNNANKVEPKFKAGDWIVRELDNSVHQVKAVIENISNGKYGYDLTKGGYISSQDANFYHLWTIQDAKEGDVLFHSDSASNGIFIFKKIIDRGFAKEIICYCDYDSEDHFCLGEHHTCCYTNAKILHPATKEQRELLFHKMKESGYDWDVDKKELKKIKDEIEIPYGAKDSELMEASYNIPKGFHAEIDEDKVVIKKGEKPTAWSEEDENIKEWIMSDINKLLALNRKSFVIADKEITWLKSIKGRVKPQQEWTMQDEEELQIALDTLEKAGQHSSAKWLKNVCLVPQSKWKPSGVQMTVLDDVITNGHLPNVNQKILKGLQEQLRKLK